MMIFGEDTVTMTNLWFTIITTAAILVPFFFVLLILVSNQYIKLHKKYLDLLKDSYRYTYENLFLTRTR